MMASHDSQARALVRSGPVSCRWLSPSACHGGGPFVEGIFEGAAGAAGEGGHQDTVTVAKFEGAQLQLKLS
jgi:hypothetical protein